MRFGFRASWGLGLTVCIALITGGCGSDDSAGVSGAGGSGGTGGTGGSDLDSGVPQPDAGREDAGMDSAMPDMDAGSDSSAPDDADVDAGQDAQQPEPDAMVPANTPPTHLSETGLYQEGSLSALADGVMAYEPRYVLWSDGADKARFLYLPEGSTIDTSDIDGFVFPVGTKAWKEFSLDGVKLETRLLWKTDDGWVQVAYAWNEAQNDAVATTRGAKNVLGTDHDIPQRVACRSCHDGAEDTLLGVSAIQLAHGGAGLTLDQLEQDGWLSDAPPDGIERPDTLEWNALGYFHANCGTCHNPRGEAWDRVDTMDLWLRVAELDDITSTRSYETTVGVLPEQAMGDDTARIAAGAPEDSMIITRMKLRGDDLAMPPIASELTDDAGVGVIEDWIETLTP